MIAEILGRLNDSDFCCGGGWRPAGLFLYSRHVGRRRVAPFGEDLTVVVVGGGERQPVPNPLESVQRTAAVPRLLAFPVFGSGDLAALLAVSFTPPGFGRRQSQRQPRPSFVFCSFEFLLIGFVPGQGV